MAQIFSHLCLCLYPFLCPSPSLSRTFSLLFKFDKNTLLKRQQGLKIGVAERVKADASAKQMFVSVIKTITADGEQVPDTDLFPGAKVSIDMQEAVPNGGLAMANDKASVTIEEWTKYVIDGLIPWIKLYRQRNPELLDENLILWVDKYVSFFFHFIIFYYFCEVTLTPWLSRTDIVQSFSHSLHAHCYALEANIQLLNERVHVMAYQGGMTPLFAPPGGRMMNQTTHLLVQKKHLQ